MAGGSLHNQRGQLVPAQGLCGDWRQRGQGQHCGRLHYEDTQCQVRKERSNLIYFDIFSLRASILAAANPNGGRYDRSKSLKQNIDMTAPIMSRFDLFFILVDDCNEVTDYAIARRIIDLHTKLEESVERTYTVEEITR